MEKIRCFIYPGQGEKIQSEDLLSFEKERFFYKKLFYNKDLQKILNEEINNPDYFQFFSLMHQLACKKQLSEQGIEADILAGFSFGEFASYYDAGILSLEDVINLVIKRNKLANRLGESKIKMLAVVGLKLAEIKNFTKEHKLNLEITNYNTEKQFVLAGEISELEKFSAQSNAATVLLNLPVAYHSKTLSKPQQEFALALEKCNFSHPNKIIISSVNGKIIQTAEEAKALLIRQMISPLLWTDVCEELKLMQIAQAVFPGDGKKLLSICRRNKIPGDLLLCNNLVNCNKL